MQSNIKNAPEPKDSQEFQFKQASCRQVCNNFKSIPTACSLIVTDAKRGLLYLAEDNKIIAIKSNDDLNNDARIEHNLPFTISRLSSSADYTYLGVTFNCCTAHIYNAASVCQNALELIHEIQLSHANQNVFAYDFRWNPAIAGMFCTVASDHSIGCFQVSMEPKKTVAILGLEKIPGLEATCVAWSPKGKQLVVGCKNGNILQLKPELKVARTIPAPVPAIGEVIAIVWISNYQFCAAYSDVNGRRINVLIVDAPKGELKANFTCYDDITYGIPDADGEFSPRYYFDHVPEWNLIFAASSSSNEIAVLGSPDAGANWELWQLLDSGRAQLPLIKTIETYPVGFTIDKSPVTLLSWGPETTLPHPMPILHIYSTAGQIVSFHMVNLLPNSPAICSPPSEPAVIKSPIVSPAAEISFQPEPAVTSTPFRIKTAEAPVDRQKIVPSVLFNDSMKNLSSISTLVTSEPVNQPAPAQNLTFTPRVEVKSKLQPLKIEDTTQKIEKKLSPVKEVPVAVEKDDLDDSICWRACREEQIHFDKELKGKMEPQNWEIGSEAEKEKLITQCAQIDEFHRELRETTNSLSNEISYLKALLLQSFAWVEETKSRHSVNSNDTSHDRHDRTKILELQRLVSYIQSQFLQATKALDIQWTEHESRQSSKIRVPNTEMIYQGMKRQSQIISSLKPIVEELHRKNRGLSSGNKISDLNRSISKLNINSTTLEMDSEGNKSEIRTKTIASIEENAEKLSKLREVLLQTRPRIIKPVSPSIVQDKLAATLSSLTSQTAIPPASKPKISIREPPSASSQLTPTTPTPPAPLPAVQKAPSPLASLNSIVEKIGSPPVELKIPTQSKTKPLSFSTSGFSSMFGNTSTPNAPTSVQMILKSSAPTPATSSVQQSVVSTTFPTITSVPVEPKVQESFTVVSTPPKTTAAKPVLSLAGSTDNTAAVQQPVSSIFSTSTLERALTSSAPISKIEIPTISQSPPTNLSSGMTLSLKDSPAPVTTSQQPVFSFASSAATTVTSKTTPTSEVGAPASMQVFSFASKPINPPEPTVIMCPTAPTTQSPIDFGKSQVAVSSVAEKPANTTPISTISFSKFSMPATTASPFEKAASTTQVSTPTTQNDKISFNLPAGTSIETLTANPSASTPSPFGQNPVPTSTNIFGGTSTSNVSPFGGTATSVFSSATPLSGNVDVAVTAAEKPAVTSSNSIFSSVAGFPQVSATSNVGSTSVFSTTSFSGALNSPMSALSFDKPTTTPVFGQTPAPTSPVSPFGQPAAISTPAATSSSFFGGLSAPGASIFGGKVASSTSMGFGGAQNPETQSVFGGTPAATPFGSFSGGAAGFNAPKPNVFGETSAFGQQSAIPAASPFGASSAFGNKAAFPGTSLFGGAKPELTSPFGSAPVFGNAALANTSPLAGSTSPLGNMNKIFGNSGGSSTFENLSTQNSALTFSTLAQKTTSPEKPAQFSGGTSFSSWR